MLKTITKATVCLTVFLIPFYFFRFDVAVIRTNIFEIAALIAFVLTLFQPDVQRFRRLKLQWSLPAAFLVAALIAVAVSGEKAAAFGIWKGWLLVPVVFAWTVQANFAKREFWKPLAALFAALCIISLWGIAQKIGLAEALFYQVGNQTFSQYISQGRVFGPFDSPNFLAMFIVPSMFLTLSLAEVIKNMLGKVLFYASYVLPVLALVFTTSRGGLVALVSATAVWLFFRFAYTKRSEPGASVLATVVVGMVGLVNLVYLLVVTKTLTLSGSDGLRTQIYHYAAVLLEKYYLLGLGLGQFQKKIAEISLGDHVFQTDGLSYALHPHNLLLSLWLNLGLLGLILFGWLVISFFKNSLNSEPRLRAGAIAAMTAILVHGLFDTTYFKNDLAAIFWLVFVISIIAKNEKNTIHR